MIIGSGGAGKSTLSAVLARTLQLPLIHLDRVFWKAGWKESTPEEFDQKVKEIVAQPAWIIDGNYSRTLAMRLEKADTVLFLDFPVWLCIWRIFARYLRYRGQTRPDMASECPESLDWEFFVWVLNYRRRTRPAVLEALENFAGTRYVLQSPGEVKDFLAGLPDGLLTDFGIDGRV